MKLFISWSGEASKVLAEGFRLWIEDVLQAVKPWMSASDLGAGARWSREIEDELNATNFGILCLTADNMEAPWLLFEAGALAKSVADGRVVPWLLNFEPNEILPGPLTSFQAKRANKDETFEMVVAINSALDVNALSGEALRRQFDIWWPHLEQVITQARDATGPATPRRSVESMIIEILEEVRDMSRINKKDPENLVRARDSRAGLSEFITKGLDAINFALGTRLNGAVLYSYRSIKNDMIFNVRYNNTNYNVIMTYFEIPYDPFKTGELIADEVSRLVSRADGG